MLKSNGAITYRELALKKNLPHLKTEGLEIHPMFNPLLEILEMHPKAETIRLSTRYQGIEAPVLVVDYPKERTIVNISLFFPYLDDLRKGVAIASIGCGSGRSKSRANPCALFEFIPCKRQQMPCRAEFAMFLRP